MKDLSSRLQSLRDLREKLCQKEKNWQEAFKARDWIVNEINFLRNMCEDDTFNKDDLKNRIDDILCVLDPSDGEEDDD